jgi:Arc/MetJ-type ribon-helix-helix transcriptional regulator
MSIELSSETEKRITEMVRSGRFSSAEELVEIAIQHLLERPAESQGKFHRLRQRIEVSGMALLSDEELRHEIRERRGQWA